MKTNAPKVMFIALDAASKDLVFEWMEQGLLPHLSALRERSAWALTRNAPAVYTGSLWPSVWTGTTAGRHGCYYNEQLAPGTYEIAEFLGRQIRKEPFWDVLSRAGHRIALFDVPKAPLAGNLNGVQIVDWGTHDADVPTCSFPPSLATELSDTYGAPPFRRCDWVMDGKRPEETLTRHLLARIDTKVAIAEDLLGREAWDLFMIGFGDSHCIGHQCWHVHDASHPAHDPETRARLGDPVQDVYVALDQAVGRLLEHAGPETTVLLHCSHGMSAHYDATYLMDEVLRRLDGREAPISRRWMDRAQRQWKKLPIRFTERFGRLARAVRRMPDGQDRRGRPCFAVPTNANSAGIRLNLKGREPDGLIERGSHEDAFVAKLVADLEELTEPLDGRPLVRDVIRSRDAFPGETSDLLPDLFVRWNRDRPISGVASPKIGRLIAEDHSTRRTGDHRPGGLVFLCDADVSPGEELPPLDDEDIAPTIASALGVDLPDVDGRSVTAPAVR